MFSMPPKDELARDNPLNIKTPRLTLYVFNTPRDESASDNPLNSMTSRLTCYVFNATKKMNQQGTMH
jgi:hypothetical protein